MPVYADEGEQVEEPVVTEAPAETEAPVEEPAEVAPETPVEPAPEAPADPEVPAEPTEEAPAETPETPEVPETPETPEEPEAPAESEEPTETPAETEEPAEEPEAPAEEAPEEEPEAEAETVASSAAAPYVVKDKPSTEDGTMEVATIAAALEKAEGTIYVRLEKDTNEALGNLAKNLNLDLGTYTFPGSVTSTGKTLTVGGTGTLSAAVTGPLTVSGEKVTISGDDQDGISSLTVKTGEAVIASAVGSGSATAIVDEGAVMTVEKNGSVDVGLSNKVTVDAGTLTVNGEVKSAIEGSGAVVSVAKNATTKNIKVDQKSTLTVDGAVTGTVDADDSAVTISGTVTATGLTSSAAAVTVKGGKLDVAASGSVSATGEYAATSNEYSGVAVEGAAVVTIEGAVSGGTGIGVNVKDRTSDVTITGGANVTGAPQGVKMTSGTVTVSGTAKVSTTVNSGETSGVGIEMANGTLNIDGGTITGYTRGVTAKDGR